MKILSWNRIDKFHILFLFLHLFRIELVLSCNFCHLSFDCSDDFTFSIAIPPIAIWFSFGNGKCLNKEFSLCIIDGSIHWNFWTSNLEWNSLTPKWRNGYFSFVDLFLGKVKFSRSIIDVKNVSIPMPEKSYQATIKLCKDIWKRPRWFPKIILRIDADIPDGIPSPPKGESSWDLVTRKTFGYCGPSDSIVSGVGSIVASILSDRIKYGGWKDWHYTERENQ